MMKEDNANQDNANHHNADHDSIYLTGQKPTGTIEITSYLTHKIVCNIVKQPWSGILRHCKKTPAFNN